MEQKMDFEQWVINLVNENSHKGILTKDVILSYYLQCNEENKFTTIDELLNAMEKIFFKNAITMVVGRKVLPEEVVGRLSIITFPAYYFY